MAETHLDSPQPQPKQTEPAVHNPYVGPRAFQEHESQFFFGRSEEVEILTSLVMTSRVSLLYAQSGAGKSSLLKAGLIPELTRQQTVGRGKRTRTHQKMQVLPVATVGGGVRQGLEAQISNVFVFNALLSMQPDMAPATVAAQTLNEGISTLLKALQPVSETAQAKLDIHELTPLSTLLILDQFEEIFTSHLDHWAERKLFFQQISDLLEAQPTIHILFSMREDYIAELTPYRNLLPNQLQLRDRFRIEPLQREAALEAVTAPAERAGRQFAEGVAEDLVDNLRRMQVSSPNRIEEESDRSTAKTAETLGAYVEPVHLQIVCQQLWDNLPVAETMITAESVKTFGDVDQALMGFYESALVKVLAHPQLNLSERLVRQWFSKQLITPARTKGLVYRGQYITEGLINSAVDILVDAYIIRADIRGSDTWYELAHDRLIEPVLAANQTWHTGYQNPLASAAQTWLEAKRDSAKLLKGIHLQDAVRYADENRKDVTALEREFLAASSGNLSPLARATQEWYDAERDPDKLLEGNQLLEAQRYAQKFPELLGPEEVRFLEASVKQEEIELHQAISDEMRRRRLTVSAIMILIIMALLTGASLWFYNQSVRSEAIAQTEAVYAREQAQIARTNEAAALNAQATSTHIRGVAQANAQIATTAEAQALQNFQAARAQIDEVGATSTNVVQAYQTAEVATGQAIATLAQVATRVATLEADREALLQAQAEASESMASNPVSQFLTSLNLLPTITPNEAVIDAGIRATQDFATQTATYLQITVTPTPTPTAICQLSPTDALFPFWERYQDRLSCPVDNMPIPGQLLWQPFSNGDVFWTTAFESYFVLAGAETGQWWLIKRDNLLSDPNCTPSGLLDEIMQALICGRPDIAEALGQPLDDGSSADLIARGFIQGFILRRGENDVYILFADDQTYIHETLLIPDSGDAETPLPTVAPPPTILPDLPTSQIIFVSNRESIPNLGNLYLMDTAGQNVSRLTQLNGSEPNYASASRNLVFSRQSPEAKVKTSLYMLDLNDSGDPVSIDQQVYDNWEPAISPDGQTVAFVSSRNNLNWEIYSMGIDGNDLLQLTDCPELDPEWLKWAPSWSPDGEQLAFVVSWDKPQYSGRASIWVTDKAGGQCRPLTNEFASKAEIVDKYPAWSPDGEQLVFVSNRRGLFELYLIKADGSDIRPVPNARPDANYPAWSPDGNWLVFSASTTDGDVTPDDIFIITIHGDAQTNLTNKLGENWYPIWIEE